VVKEISLLVILQKERGVIKKKYMLKKHRKNVLQSKSIEKVKKKESMTPLQNKSKKRISKQGVFRKKHKNIAHTCTSRLSCMTSLFLDPVFGSTTSCGTSEPHTSPTSSSNILDFCGRLGYT
jgi:hypothetical protein